MSTGLNTGRAQLADQHIVVNQLRKSLEIALADLEELRGGRSSASKAIATGQADLSVDPAYSTLTSTEEMNTTATFYEPHHPGWDGPQSTAPIEVTGTYDGRYGDTTLEFRATQTRTVGSNKSIKLNVYDGNTKVDSISWGAWQTGTRTTKAGLTVDLGSAGGYLQKNESFFVDVYDTVGTDLDTDETFDTLESEVESAISDGSFELNGVTIQVFADDTLEDVIDRIDSSGAGVTASVQGDLFTLTRDEYGELDISVGSDTSGFLAAVKLSTAVVDLGRPDDVWTTPIGEVDAFQGVTNGSFVINDETFTIDTATDSLQDILDDINSSGAGVVADLDLDTGTLTLRSLEAGGIVDLQDTTGFFDAFEIDNDRYVGKEGGALPGYKRREVAEILEKVVEDLNTLLVEHGIDELKGLKQSITEHFDDDDLDSGWGLDLDLKGESTLSSEDLDRALVLRPEDVFETLLGQERGTVETQTGLLESMVAALATLEEDLGARHGYTGLLFDRAA